MWTDKHTTAIERTYNELHGTLKECKSRKDCIAAINNHNWPQGPYGAFEGISDTVQKVIANRAITHRLHEVMMEANPQQETP